MKETRNEDIYNRIGEVLNVPEIVRTHCLMCAFADWPAMDTNGIKDDETMCIISYDIRNKIECPFYKYGGRKLFLESLYSAVEDEVNLIEEIHQESLKTILYGYDAETSLERAISNIKKRRKKNNGLSVRRNK